MSGRALERRMRLRTQTQENGYLPDVPGAFYKPVAIRVDLSDPDQLTGMFLSPGKSLLFEYPGRNPDSPSYVAVHYEKEYGTNVHVLDGGRLLYSVQADITGRLPRMFSELESFFDYRYTPHTLADGTMEAKARITFRKHPGRIWIPEFGKASLIRADGEIVTVRQSQRAGDIPQMLVRTHRSKLWEPVAIGKSYPFTDVVGDTFAAAHLHELKQLLPNAEPVPDGFVPPQWRSTLPQVEWVNYNTVTFIDIGPGTQQSHLTLLEVSDGNVLVQLRDPMLSHLPTPRLVLRNYVTPNASFHTNTYQVCYGHDVTREINAGKRHDILFNTGQDTAHSVGTVGKNSTEGRNAIGFAPGSYLYPMRVIIPKKEQVKLHFQTNHGPVVIGVSNINRDISPYTAIRMGDTTGMLPANSAVTIPINEMSIRVTGVK